MNLTTQATWKTDNTPSEGGKGSEHCYQVQWKDVAGFNKKLNRVQKFRDLQNFHALWKKNSPRILFNNENSECYKGQGYFITLLKSMKD